MIYDLKPDGDIWFILTVELALSDIYKIGLTSFRFIRS